MKKYITLFLLLFLPVSITWADPLLEKQKSTNLIWKNARVGLELGLGIPMGIFGEKHCLDL